MPNFAPTKRRSTLCSQRSSRSAPTNRSEPCAAACYATIERDEGSRVLVATLIRERLLTSSAPDGRAVIAVAHEALLRVWPPAVAWLSRNREFLRLRAVVAQSFARWNGANRDDSLLLPPGLPLEEAGRLLTIEAGRLDMSERSYIEASRERAATQAAKERAQEEAIRERNFFLSQLNLAIRKTMLRALLVRRVQLKVTEREYHPSYSNFLKVSATAEEASTDIATIDALLSGQGRWHPKAAIHGHSFGAHGDYAEGWKFPCCGAKAITFDDAPSQIRDTGCSAITVGSSEPFRLSARSPSD